MKTLFGWFVLFLFVWLAASSSAPSLPPEPRQLAAKCVGADPCLACKTCRSCKHCRGAGSCGACKKEKEKSAIAYFGEPLCR